jgi:hypothetical protein
MSFNLPQAIHKNKPLDVYAHPGLFICLLIVKATSSHEIGWLWKSCKADQEKMVKLQRTLNN